MQSDDRVAGALAALRPQIALCRFLISSTQERARNTLTSESGPSLTRSTLGNFAAGRIDPDRFSMILSGAAPLDNASQEAMQRIDELLESLLLAGDDLFVVDVRREASVREAFAARIARFGTVFAASALVEQVRRRTYDPTFHALPLAGYPFEKWTTGERMLAPPLVFHGCGVNSDVLALANSLDGCVRMILLFDEPYAAATLARFISPGTLVAQASDLTIVEKLADYEGPAIVAVLNGNEARFIHDPRAAGAMWQRIQVTRMPDASPRKAIGTRSSWQQRDDIALLKTLIEPPSLTTNVNRASGSSNGMTTDPVERLTAWLLEQTPHDGVA